MSIQASDPGRFLSSPAPFAAFRQRAGFVSKSPFLIKDYSERDREMLAAIAQLPKPGDVPDSLQKLQASFEIGELEGLVRKVMHLTEEHRSRATTVKESRSQSVSSEARVSKSSEEGEGVVSSPRKVEKRRPPERALSPVKKQRSFIETGSAVDLLKIRAEYDIAIQGAICLQYLFPEMLVKLFPKEEERRAVDGLIRSYGFIRFLGTSLNRAVDTAFPEPPPILFSVLCRLGKRQTLSRVVRLPSPKDFPPLPKMFDSDPRLSEAALPKLAEQMGFLRYQCLGIYTQMPKGARRSLNAFCAAVFIKDMIGWPLRDCLQAAFRGRYPSDQELDRLIREVTLSDSLHPVVLDEEKQGKARSIQEVFDFPFLKFPILFRQLLKHAAQFPPEVRFASFFHKQIEAVHRLKETALLPHDEAVRRCFGEGALRRHFAQQDLSIAVEKTLEELDRLSPRSFYEHRLLESEEGIRRLKKNVRGDVQGYFKRVEEVLLENAGMPPRLAAQAVFTRTALRLLFESDNDCANGKAFVQLLDEAAAIE